MNWKLQFLALFVVFGAATAFNKPFARLWEYNAFGIQNTTKKGNTANLFFGLPYAKQPERFEKAESLKPSLLKVVNADKWPLACHQVVDVAPLGFTVTEDCLKFNVFAPTKPSLKPRPVFIFIHGGGYEYGFTEEYGWEYFVDNFVTRDIIMVTLQYRLAHYGFLATEDGVINGNFGHFDQIEALKFIKRNILAFGGDPNRITLSGHSAGSISVHTLSLSPKTHGLYNQEIHIASSNYAQWPINSKFVFDHSTLISNAVGCSQADTHARKACLKQVDPQRFWDVRTELNLTDFPFQSRDVLYWTTVYDNDLFEGKKIDELQKIAPKRNTLYGLDAGEGLVWSIHTDNIITNVFSVGRGFSPADRHLANADDIKDRLLRQLMTNTSVFTPAVQEEVFEKVFNFYHIGDQYAAGNPLHYWEKYSEIFTDTMMKTPTNIEINEKIKYGFKNQYMFLFNYTRPQDRPVIGNLPGHGYFLMYFAGLEIYTTFGINETSTDLAVQDHLAQMFETFVKTGTPKSNGVTAPKITSKDRLPYMEFTDSVIIDDVDFSPKTKFWQELGEHYHYDLIRDIPI